MGPEELRCASWFRPVSFSFLPLAESFIINSFVLEAEMAGPGRAGGRSAAPASVLFKGRCHVCGEALVPQVGFISFHHVLRNKIYASVCMHAKSLQLCPTLCSPMDCSPAGSSVPVSSLVTFKCQGWVGG